MTERPVARSPVSQHPELASGPLPSARARVGVLALWASDPCECTWEQLREQRHEVIVPGEMHETRGNIPESIKLLGKLNKIVVDGVKSRTSRRGNRSGLVE